MPRGVPRAREQQPSFDDAGQVSAEALAVGAVDAAGEPAAEAQQTPADEPSLFDVTLDEVGVLTPEQVRIQELENLLAAERGRKDVEPELEVVDRPGDDGNIIIHFLEDGFSALGHVWYRGQELEFVPGSQAYKDTFDRRGRTWLDLRHDEFAQVDRWEKVMFRAGPWPGKTLRDAAAVPFQPVKDDRGRLVPPPSDDDFARAEAAESKRRRAAPKLPAR